MATSQVFETYELLELILLHLPLVDRLLAERVSKTFQSILKRSKKIRQALYREPITESVTMAFRKITHEVDHPYADRQGRGWATSDSTSQKPIVNPFIIPHFLSAHEFPSFLHERFIEPRYGLNAGDRVGRVVEALCRKGASWKTMLITQPPPCELTFPCIETTGREDEGCFQVTNGEGVRLCDIRASA